MEIQYKGLNCKIFFSSEANGFYGEVINSEDHITFQAETTESIMQALEEAINLYRQYKQSPRQLALNNGYVHHAN